MRTTFVNVMVTVVLAAVGVPSVAAQDEAGSLAKARRELQQQLETSLAELAALEERIAEDRLPMDRELRRLEDELSELRRRFQERRRLLDSRALDISNLRGEVEGRQDEAVYVANLLGDYVRKLEAGMHIAELQRHEEALEAARSAAADSEADEWAVAAAQLELLGMSMARLDEALGGTVFTGHAIGPDGLQVHGTFVLAGPATVFVADDGGCAGTVEGPLNSVEPTVFAFDDPELAAAASELVADGVGELPLDPTLGNAHRIAAVDESFVEHVQKGGPVMVPIFVLAGLALLVALYKLLTLSLMPRPRRREIERLLAGVGQGDEAAALEAAQKMRGPIGRMLEAGVRHLREPRELIEEIMYERVLTTRIRAHGLLPFIAICAASAPLLGLLGTVTGIINTFKQITVYGSGDVKMLSGGISEALITTKFGLIVAIPSLLLHAYLSRKAKARIGEMETTAVEFANQVSKSEALRRERVTRSAVEPRIDPEVLRGEVAGILREMLSPIGAGEPTVDLLYDPPAPSTGAEVAHANSGSRHRSQSG